MGKLRRVRRSAYHLERQPYYHIELEVYRRWRSGDRRPPVDDTSFADGYALLDEHVGQGRTVARVRIIEEPPTEYQLFEHWCGRWNTAHGEILRSMPRPVAERVGLDRPGEHVDDWWLLDGTTLMVMPFDRHGHLQPPYLVTDRQVVNAALADWEIAVAHSTVDEYDSPVDRG